MPESDNLLSGIMLSDELFLIYSYFLVILLLISQETLIKKRNMK